MKTKGTCFIFTELMWTIIRLLLKSSYHPKFIDAFRCVKYVHERNINI